MPPATRTPGAALGLLHDDVLELRRHRDLAVAEGEAPERARPAVRPAAIDRDGYRRLRHQRCQSDDVADRQVGHRFVVLLEHRIVGHLASLEVGHDLYRHAAHAALVQDLAHGRILEVRRGRGVNGAEQEDALVAEVQAARPEFVEEVLRQHRIAAVVFDERAYVHDVARIGADEVEDRQVAAHQHALADLLDVQVGLFRIERRRQRLGAQVIIHAALDLALGHIALVGEILAVHVGEQLEQQPHRGLRAYLRAGRLQEGVRLADNDDVVLFLDDGSRRAVEGYVVLEVVNQRHVLLLVAASCEPWLALDDDGHAAAWTRIGQVPRWWPFARAGTVGKRTERRRRRLWRRTPSAILPSVVLVLFLTYRAD